MIKPLCNNKLNQQILIRILKCHVFSTLLNSVEAWTTTEATERKTEAFEFWCCRRMSLISYTTNTEVSQRIGKEKELMNSVKKWKTQYLGHIIRNKKYRLRRLILEGKINIKLGPGRRRNFWLKNLRQPTNITTTELFGAAINKIKCAKVVANISTHTAPWEE